MNNPILKLAFALVVIVGTILFGISSYRTKIAEYENKLELERIRREFLERAPIARQVAEPAKYSFEMQQLFKWYFGELNEHYKRVPELKHYDRYLTALDERKKDNRITRSEYEQYAERYKATRAIWDFLAEIGEKGKKYVPVFTGVDNGLRFDIYDVQYTDNKNGKDPKVRLYFAFHGAQRKWIVDSNASNAARKVSKLNVSSSFDIFFSGLDSNGKVFGEMRGNGEAFKIEAPDRFIDEFPSGIVFGIFDLPKVPAEVTEAELTFDASTRSVISGEQISGKFVWKFPVTAEWKLPEGAAWEGAKEEMRVMEDDKGKKKENKPLPQKKASR